MSKKLDINEVCEYVSNCSDKDLYFIQKIIELRREKIQNNMFEGATNL